MVIAQDNPEQSHDPVSAIHISGGLILDRVSVLAGSLPSQTPTSPDCEKNWLGMGLSNYGSYSSSLDSNGAPPPYDWAVGHINGHSQPMPPIMPVSVGSLLTQIQPDGSIKISHPTVPYTLNFPNGFRMADTLRITGRVNDLGGTQTFDIHLFDDRDNIILMVHVTFGRNQRDATVARKSRFDGVWSTEEQYGRMPIVFNRPFTMAISADNEKFTIRQHNSLIASYSAIRTPIYAGRMEIFGHLTVHEIDYDAKSSTCGGTTLNSVCERL